MEVGTPLGEYPFEFRRLELRGGRLVVVGIVGGLESSLHVGPRDLAWPASRLGPPLFLLLLLLLGRRRRAARQENLRVSRLARSRPK